MKESVLPQPASKGDQSYLSSPANENNTDCEFIIYYGKPQTCPPTFLTHLGNAHPEKTNIPEVPSLPPLLLTAPKLTPSPPSAS